MALVVIAVLVALWVLGRSGAGKQVAEAVQDSAASARVIGDGMLQKLAQAIYDFEDPKRNAVATRNNNPGNLRPPDGKANFWKGQVGVAKGGYAVFASFGDGWAALLGDLKIKARKHPTWNLQNLFNVWLGGGANSAPPAAEGNAVTYAQFVARKLGAAVSTTLGQISGGANG